MPTLSNPIDSQKIYLEILQKCAGKLNNTRSWKLNSQMHTVIHINLSSNTDGLLIMLGLQGTCVQPFPPNLHRLFLLTLTYYKYVLCNFVMFRKDDQATTKTIYTHMFEAEDLPKRVDNLKILMITIKMLTSKVLIYLLRKTVFQSEYLLCGKLCQCWIT